MLDIRQSNHLLSQPPPSTSGAYWNHNIKQSSCLTTWEHTDKIPATPRPLQAERQPMAISFDEARKVVNTIGSQRSGRILQDEELLPLDKAVGRVTKHELCSPRSTPTFDSAAMDGYAVLARQTSEASPTNPIQLRVMGYTAAGARPLEVDDKIYGDLVPCVEIKTGSPFPSVRSTKLQFDGLIPVEHTRIIREGGEGRIVEISNVPLTSWHKRIAGSDFHEGELILAKGAVVEPKHIMALASVGFKQIAVMRKVRVGVISVGSELSTTRHQHQHEQSLAPYKIPDANGYYLTAALHEMGMDGTYLGAVPSDAEILTSALREHMARDSFDVIIATEGALSGRIEQLPTTIATLKGAVHFSHVRMNPGSPVIFATLPGADAMGVPQHGSFYGSAASSSSQFVSPPKTPGPAVYAGSNGPAFFGLLGAPIASVASFRFLVAPYIRQLHGMNEEPAIMGIVGVTPPGDTFGRHTRSQSVSATAPADVVAKGHAQMDIFRRGSVLSNEKGVTVTISREQSVMKTSPFASSNCWVHIPQGHAGLREDDLVSIYPFCSPKV